MRNITCLVFWLCWALSITAGQITNDQEHKMDAVILFSVLESLFDGGHWRSPFLANLTDGGKVCWVVLVCFFNCFYYCKS